MSGQRGMRIAVNQEDFYGNNPRYRQTTTQYEMDPSKSRKNRSKRKGTSPDPASREYRQKMQQYSQSQYNSNNYDESKQQQQQTSHRRTRSRQDRDRTKKNRARSANPPLAENSTEEDSEDSNENSDDYGSNDNPNLAYKESVDEPYHIDSDNEEEMQAKRIREFERKKKAKAAQAQAQQSPSSQQQSPKYNDELSNRRRSKQSSKTRERRSKNSKKDRSNTRDKGQRKARTPNPAEMYENEMDSHHNHNNSNNNNNRGRSTGNAGDKSSNKRRVARKSRPRDRHNTQGGASTAGQTEALDIEITSHQNGSYDDTNIGMPQRRRERNKRGGGGGGGSDARHGGHGGGPQQHFKGTRSYGYTIDETMTAQSASEDYGPMVRGPKRGGGGASAMGSVSPNNGKGGGNSLIYDPTKKKNTYMYNSSNVANMTNSQRNHSMQNNRDRTRNRNRDKSGKNKEQRRLTVDVPRGSKRRGGDRGGNRNNMRKHGSPGASGQSGMSGNDEEFADYNQYSGDDGYDPSNNELDPLPQNGTVISPRNQMASGGGSNEPSQSNEDASGRRSRSRNRNGKHKHTGDYQMTENGAYRDENNHARRRRRSASKSATPMPKKDANSAAGGGGGGGALTPGGDKVGSRSGRRSKSKKSKESKLNRGKLAEDYWIKEKMGKGNFAVVRRAIRKSDNREFAAKIISKKHLSSREIAELDNEVDILCKLYHPNVVEVVEVLDTPRHLYIVLELLTGGELFDRIVSKGRFTEQQAANITKQLASALKYLHSIRIVHRDLKPENIIYKTPSDDAPIKITDFGLGRDMGQDPKESGYRKTLNTACGTPGYVAPEILKAHPYDEYVDLWSCGVILYIMLCGYPPFTGGRNQNKLYRKIKRGEYSFPSPAWDNVSAMAKDCVKSLLTVDPRNRMSAAELLDHPWVQNTEIHAGKNLVNEEFAANLTHYLHKKRLRRGVELVIILNRMIRAAGLEKVAKEQRKQFRERLRAHKEKVKQEKWDEIEAYRKQGLISDKDYQKLNFMKTPPIDYSKV